MISKLFNPFRYIAGGKSLLIGIPLLLLTALIGYLSGINFPDVLSAKVGYSQPLYIGIIHNLCNWIALAAILYITSLIFSKSNVRFIDIFGTQALARFPYLIISIIGFAWKPINMNAKASFSIGEMFIIIPTIIISLILLIWQIVLMYNAFKESSNIKGNKSFVLFAISLIAAIAASIFLAQGTIALIS